MLKYETIEDSDETTISYDFIILNKLVLIKNKDAKNFKDIELDIINNCTVEKEDIYSNLLNLGKSYFKCTKLSSYKFKDFLCHDEFEEIIQNVSFKLKLSMSKTDDMNDEERKKEKKKATENLISFKNEISKYENISPILSESLPLENNLINITLEWIKEYGFPYSIIFSIFPQKEFINNCIYLYLFDDCCKHLYEATTAYYLDVDEKKIDNIKRLFKNYEIFKEDKISNKILGNFNFKKTRIFNEYGYNATLSEEEIDVFNVPVTKENIDINLIVLRRLLLNAAYQIINCRSICDIDKSYKVYNDRPFYNEITKSYMVLDSSNSMIGIAYNQLIRNITSYYVGYHKKTCANPNCNNVFEIEKGNQKYCKTCINKKIPHKLRVEKFSKKRKSQ